MLKHLYIKNYALIDALDIDFASGFSVITGETGAGKSIILGAIGLLLGQRADPKAVKGDATKCMIEATFDLSGMNQIATLTKSESSMARWFDDNDFEYDDTCCIIRREVTAAGKSRGFINDTPATLTQMRELGEMLIDVHSQHQNLLLQKDNFQLKVIDIIAANAKVRNEYTKAYKEYHKAKKELEDIRNAAEAAKNNEEFMRFQFDELQSAMLQDGEQEQLEEEQQLATHTEDIKSALYEADNLLNNDDNGIVFMTSQTTQRISSAVPIYPKLSELADRLESSLIELKDIAQEINNEASAIDFDPERLAYVNERLDKIYFLEKKYKKENISELLEEQERLRQTIDLLDCSDDDIIKKEKEVEVLFTTAQKNADKLSQSRKDIVDSLQNDVVTRLVALGMPSATFKIDIETRELADDGQDKVAFLFSANKGMPLRPVAQVASGGEIARLMLTLKALISRAVKLPTIIFDEIDTGVSGKIAEQMAAIMRDMGNSDRQDLSITHLPQIAACGAHHYKVEKHETQEATTSVMRLLDKEERIREIAQMLSGSDITEAAMTHAKEMINANS